MGQMWRIAVCLFMVAIPVFSGTKPGSNPVIVSAHQGPEDLKRIYQALQRQLDEENTEFRNMLEHPRRIQ